MSDLILGGIVRPAGVSRSNGSWVVNDPPNVSIAKRTRVVVVIQATGYHPNLAARSLASQHSRMVGLVLPRSVSAFFTDPYYPYLTQGIVQACNQNDYTLARFLVGTTEDEEKIISRVTRKGFLDGWSWSCSTSRKPVVSQTQKPA